MCIPTPSLASKYDDQSSSIINFMEDNIILLALLGTILQQKLRGRDTSSRSIISHPPLKLNHTYLRVHFHFEWLRHSSTSTKTFPVDVRSNEKMWTNIRFGKFLTYLIGSHPDGKSFSFPSFSSIHIIVQELRFMEEFSFCIVNSFSIQVVSITTLISLIEGRRPG